MNKANLLSTIAIGMAMGGMDMDGRLSSLPKTPDWDKDIEEDEEYVKICARTSTLSYIHRDLISKRVEFKYTPRWKNHTKWLYQDILEQSDLPTILARLMNIGTRELIRFRRGPSEKDGKPSVGILYRELVDDGDVEYLESLRERGAVLRSAALVQAARDRELRIKKSREAAKLRRKERRRIKKRAGG